MWRVSILHNMTSKSLLPKVQSLPLFANLNWEIDRRSPLANNAGVLFLDSAQKPLLGGYRVEGIWKPRLDGLEWCNLILPANRPPGITILPVCLMIPYQLLNDCRWHRTFAINGRDGSNTVHSIQATPPASNRFGLYQTHNIQWRSPKQH